MPAFSCVVAGKCITCASTSISFLASGQLPPRSYWRQTRPTFQAREPRFAFGRGIVLVNAGLSAHLRNASIPPRESEPAASAVVPSQNNAQLIKRASCSCDEPNSTNLERASHFTRFCALAARLAAKAGAHQRPSHSRHSAIQSSIGTVVAIGKPAFVANLGEFTGRLAAANCFYALFLQRNGARVLYVIP